MLSQLSYTPNQVFHIRGATGIYCTPIGTASARLFFCSIGGHTMAGRACIHKTLNVRIQLLNATDVLANARMINFTSIGERYHFTTQLL